MRAWARRRPSSVRGVLAWMRCVHGGEQVPWLEMPVAMQDDDRNLRLLRDGTVIAYPEAQNGEVDLEVLHEWTNPNGRKTTHQFKTPGGKEHGTCFEVKLETGAGKDETGTRADVKHLQGGRQRRLRDRDPGQEVEGGVCGTRGRVGDSRGGAF